MREINYTNFIIFLAIVIVVLIIIIRSKKEKISSLKEKLKEVTTSHEKLKKNYNQVLIELSDCRKALEELQNRSGGLSDRLSNYAQRYKLTSEELSVCLNELNSLQHRINEEAELRFYSVMNEFAKHCPFSQSSTFRHISSSAIAQDDRFKNAFLDTTMTLVSVPTISAKVKGQSGEVYDVTLDSCTCNDYQFRHQPCKHMYRLAIHAGALSRVNTRSVERCLNKYYSETDRVSRELKAMKKSISGDKLYVTNEKKAVKADLAELEQQRIAIQSLNEDCYESFLNKLQSKGYNPTWIAKMYGEYYDMFTDKLVAELTGRVRPARAAASTIEKNYKEEMRTMSERAKYNESLVLLYESFFPDLPTLCEFTPDDTIQAIEELSDIKSDSEYDSVRQWISKADYDLLPREEKFQLALDNYKHRKRSNWEAGRDYERYICYLYEKQGYKVVCFGALKGLDDLGRDLYAHKGADTIIIQCKRWAPQKLIHEKHIYQLFGTVTDYSIDHPLVNTHGLLLSTCSLSDKAKEVADRIGIEYEENAQFTDYPLIKCNISKTGEKIYHLPFDQQYDKVQINYAAGEFYANSITEAERKGFRRAYRHSIAAEQ
nr:MAG TPA_asm: Restriction endonuclease [Caudoviricetes sp.]